MNEKISYVVIELNKSTGEETKKDFVRGEKMAEWLIKKRNDENTDSNVTYKLRRSSQTTYPTPKKSSTGKQRRKRR